MWLNKNDNTVIKKPIDITIDGVQHSKIIFSKWSEAELNAIGIYKATVDEIPNRRYYTYDEVVDFVNNRIVRTPVEKPLADIQALFLSDIDKIVESKQQPFDVYYIRNLKGRKTVPVVVQNEVDSIYSQQDTKETAINALGSVADCILYEKQPYDYTITAEDVANDLTGTLVEGTIVTRYRNNVTDWV